jgi:hypothetical protein
LARDVEQARPAFGREGHTTGRSFGEHDEAPEQESVDKDRNFNTVGG